MADNLCANYALTTSVNTWSQKMDVLRCACTLCAAFALYWSVVSQANQDVLLDEDLDYQQRLLMNPTSSQLAAEERGRVHIYDSLEMNTINKALDQQFDRIENMMFIRIHHLPSTGAGAVIIEDDACD
jgi:hypothetical protein